MKVYYKTLRNQKVRNISIKDFDFSCGSPDLFVYIEDRPVKGKIKFKHSKHGALVEIRLPRQNASWEQE